MTCSVTITGAVSVGPNQYTVSGTATDCTDVTVQISCLGVGGETDRWQGTATVNSNGDWQLQTGQQKCPCGQPVTIDAWCTANPGCAATTFTGTVPCAGDPCCPSTTVRFVPRGCVNGLYQVDFTVIATLPASANCSYSYTLDFGDGTPLFAFSSTTSTTTPITHYYNIPTSQTLTATVHFSQPNDCPDASVQVPVKHCTPDCPPIDFSHTTGPCNADGTRNVTVSATFSASGMITGSMTGTCWSGAVTGTQSGTLTLIQPLALAAGSCTVTASFNGCRAQSYTFTVPDCCPIVTFSEAACGSPICNGSGKRPVVIKASVTPQTAVPVQALLVDIDSGSVIDNGFGPPAFDLHGSFDYSEGSHSVGVIFNAPSDCPPQTFTFCVPGCESVRCLGLHLWLLASLSVAIATSAIVGLWALAAANTWLGPLIDRYLDEALVISLVQLMIVPFIIGALVFLLWWALCIRFLGVSIGWCCATRCLWLVTAWQTFFIVAFTLLWFLSCNFLLHLIGAILFFLLGLLFFNWWKKRCCPGKCDGLFYIFVALFVGVSLCCVFLDNQFNLSTVCFKYTGIAFTWYWWLWEITRVLRYIIVAAGVFYFLAWLKCESDCRSS